MERKESESYFVQVVPIDRDDALLIPERQWSMEEVCAIFGVPAGLLQTVEIEQSYRQACEAAGKWVQRIKDRGKECS